MNNHEIFSGKDLEIADRIQKLRLCILVHSCLYYELNTNVISDKDWDVWAKELVQLQYDYPEISKKVCRYEDFKDWDASTGAFLPLKDRWVIRTAKRLISLSSATVINAQEKKPPEIKKKKLF